MVENTNMASFGEKGWDEEAPKGRSDYFNIKDDGQYLMRICGKPHEYAAHWVDGDGGSRIKVNCAAKDCVLCKKGLKVSVRYLVPVLLRDENRVALTEFGPQVFGGIKKLYKTAAWGNPMGYDIMIDKEKKRGASGMYFVTPIAKSDFESSEKAMIKEFLERINLKEMSAPSTNEEIAEKLGPQLVARLGLNASSSKASSAAPASGNTASAATDEYNFDD